jgi:hypothetical protein
MSSESDSKPLPHQAFVDVQSLANSLADGRILARALQWRIREDLGEKILGAR